jgi:hypothetical protein
MADTSRINIPRVAMGGALAGIVHFAVTGVVNGLVLSAPLQDWLRGAGALLHPPAPATSMSLWGLMSLTYGLVGVWTYAAMRPRFGAGPKTALLAGVSLWIVSKLAVAFDLSALGIVPVEIVVGQSIGGLIAVVLGVLLGSWNYRE